MLALCTYLLSVVAGCVLYMDGCGWVCIVHGWVWLGVYCTWMGVAGCVLYMGGCGWVCIVHGWVWLGVYCTWLGVAGCVLYMGGCGWVCIVHGWVWLGVYCTWLGVAGCGWVCMVRSASTGLLLQGHSDGVNHVSCIGDAKYGSLDDLLHQL